MLGPTNHRTRPPQDNRKVHLPGAAAVVGVCPVRGFTDPTIYCAVGWALCPHHGYYFKVTAWESYQVSLVGTNFRDKSPLILHKWAIRKSKHHDNQLGKRQNLLFTIIFYYCLLWAPLCYSFICSEWNNSGHWPSNPCYKCLAKISILRILKRWQTKANLLIQD